MNRTHLALACMLATGAATVSSQTAEPPARTREAVSTSSKARVDEALGHAGVKPRRLLLLGTFHFDDAGLDDYKPQHHFDALSDRRQGEIKELLTLLDAFDADKVCIERKADQQDNLDATYAQYIENNLELGANEIYQIGFRLAKMEELPGVTTIDAEGRWFESYENPEEWAKAHGLEDKLKNPFLPAIYPYMLEQDKRTDAWPLLDTLLDMNDESVLRATYGMYLTGQFAVGDGESFPGADGFVTAWNNRNLRIFQNILNTTEPGENVVVIIGAGHVPLLRFMAECSPEIELVDLIDVLGDKANTEKEPSTKSGD